MLNLDETCVLASGETTNIVGASKRSKHENHRDESQESITTARTGSDGSSSGPWMFLGKVVKMVCPTLKYIHKKGAPPGSVVIMTPNAYTTGELWRAQALYLCKVIMEMPVIQDHPA